MTYSEILYEDNHIIAVNKRAGSLVQKDRTGDRCIADDIKDYIKVKYNKPGDVFLGTVHRLDRPVSGIMIFARTSKATTRLNEAFRNNKIHKTYWAVTEECPSKKSDDLKEYLLKNEKKNKSSVVYNHPKSKLSELTYHWLDSKNKSHLLEVHPITGRHHQIRVMLSHIGAVIKGDLKYGASKANKDGNISLHARSIEFIHPVKKEKMILEAQPPRTREWMAYESS